MKIFIITTSLNRAEFIVDGGLSGGALELFKKYPHLNITSEPDKGMYDALNVSLEFASGEIIGFLNSDDMYSEGGFTATAKTFLDNSIFAVAGKTLIFSVAQNAYRKKPRAARGLQRHGLLPRCDENIRVNWGTA